ncbi:hypothetical protein ACFQ6C_18580 [Streptomyces sp. NPDC056454]|uniref:hypothetical protein n=1 Tax=Streptomyces sp. NPDC056454 TaxID=3345823 RepID=UPI00369E8333
MLMTVIRWIDGEVLPDTWLHLKNLVRAMGATDQEVEAFHRAYTRTVDARSRRCPLRTCPTWRQNRAQARDCWLDGET